jgi:hypothetical protein
MAMQGQERIAYETGYADGVFGRPLDNPYNQSVVPKSYSFYEQGYAEGSGSDTPPRGPTGPTGSTGPAGPQGAVGNNGIDGADGLAFLQGAGPPAAGLGKPGDTYYDTTTAGDIYLKTDVVTWTFVTSIGDVTLALQLDDTGGAPQVLYKGEAAAGSITSGALWRIQEITIQTDGDVAILWADGNTNFDNIYDDRLGLSYS